MPEDTAAAGTAAGDSAAQGQHAATPTPGTDDRSAEEMLGDAVDASESDAEDPAKALAAAQADAKKWRDLSRGNERKAKENAEAARKLADIEEANKTEAQKLNDRLAAAEQRAATAESLHHRTLAAARYQVPPSLIDRITGSTEDECDASAEALAAAINEAASAIAGAAKANGAATQRQQTRPVESLRPGAVPAGTATETDPNAQLRGLLAGSRK